MAQKIAVLVAVALAAGVALADELQAPEGLIGLETETGAGWLAIRVQVPEDSAVSGLMWYNNDGSVVFPQILAGTGFANGPGLIEAALPVAGSVSGGSSAWSEVMFEEPVAASLGSLYFVFEFPAGSGFTAAGLGGGPAVGYTQTNAGCRGWISGDGEEWSRLHESYGFAVMPNFIPFVPGMAVKSLDQPRGGVAPVIEAPYLTIAPNPFNPQAEVRFGLPQAARVIVDVFDVRGRRVKRLVEGEYPAGPHAVTWSGLDEAGGSVASGVYLARLDAGDVVLVQRLSLLK